jgi:hypothetical protein
LINNRQQGGRRRGRGGQRQIGGGGGGGGQPGNRQDNRQRGNAAQLLEKYKSLARDAQLAGDRVQTEYYLQYADHYFRVLGESRSRFEEQRRQRGDSDEDEGEDDLVEADGEGSDGEERQERQDRPQRQDRGERYSPREPREPREAREARGAREPRRYVRDDRGGNDDGDEDGSTQRTNGADDDSLPLDVLPPAIGADGPSSLVIDELPEPAPAARRTRAPRRPKNDDGVAPAA